MTTKLGDLNIKLSTGQIQARKEHKGTDSPTIPCPVLVPRAIKDGAIDHSCLSSFEALKSDCDLKLTKKGDIVIKNSTPYDACIVGCDDEGLFIPSFCIVLENGDPKVDSYYLLAFLNSKKAKERFSSYGVGRLAIINKKCILDLDFPMVGLYEQNEIGERYKKSIEKIKAMKKIVSLEQEWYDTYFGRDGKEGY